MTTFKAALNKSLNKSKKVKGDTAYVVGPDGKPTNAQLHDDIMAGVPTTRGEKYAKAALKGQISDEALKLFT